LVVAPGLRRILKLLPVGRRRRDDQQEETLDDLISRGAGLEEEYVMDYFEK
jgi:hypothetical protein